MSVSYPSEIIPSDFCEKSRSEIYNDTRKSCWDVLFERENEKTHTLYTARAPGVTVSEARRVVVALESKTPTLSVVISSAILMLFFYLYFRPDVSCARAFAF